MHLISEVIETLKAKYQQPLEPIPALPDYPVLPEHINNENALVVTKIGRAYKVDNLKERKCFMVSKVNEIVMCSCESGKEEKHCEHKRAVLEDYKRFKKLRADESIKKRIGANMSAYIYRLNQIVKEFERRGDVNNCTYYYYKGKLSGLKLNLRIVIEA